MPETHQGVKNKSIVYALQPSKRVGILSALSRHSGRHLNILVAERLCLLLSLATPGAFLGGGTVALVAGAVGWRIGRRSRRRRGANVRKDLVNLY